MRSKELINGVLALTLAACTRSVSTQPIPEGTPVRGNIDVPISPEPIFPSQVAPTTATPVVPAEGLNLETLVAVVDDSVNQAMAESAGTANAVNRANAQASAEKTPAPPKKTEAPIEASTAVTIPTVALFTSPPSLYEAGDNLPFGELTDGVAKIVLPRYLDYSSAAAYQLSHYKEARTQDYAAAMKFAPLIDENGDGELDFPTHRGPDFWVDQSGLGFAGDELVLQGKAEVIALSPDHFTLGEDGKQRVEMIIDERNVEFAVLSAIRAALVMRHPDMTPAELYKTYDGDIQTAFKKVMSDNGYKPDTSEEWPGPEEDLGTIDSFLDENGEVCVGYRIAKNNRSDQSPEQFRKVRYVKDQEAKTDGDDESWQVFDTRTDLTIFAVFNPKAAGFLGSIRIDILNSGAPQDTQRTDEARSLSLMKDSGVKLVRLEQGRWVKCAPKPTLIIDATGTATFVAPAATPVETPASTTEPEKTATLPPATVPPAPSETQPATQPVATATRPAPTDTDVPPTASATATATQFIPPTLTQVATATIVPPASSTLQGIESETPPAPDPTDIPTAINTATPPPNTIVPPPTTPAPVASETPLGVQNHLNRLFKRNDTVNRAFNWAIDGSKPNYELN